MCAAARSCGGRDLSGCARSLPAAAALIQMRAAAALQRTTRRHRRGVTNSAGLVPPAIPPHLLADGAGDPRRPRLHLRHAPLGRAACDFQHQLGTRRFLELLTLADRDDECAGAADDAVLVI